MTRITDIKIENFRALKSITFTMDRMAVLIGENDVGKTSVLNALRVFFRNKKLCDKYDFYQFKLDNTVIIELTFTGDENPYSVRRSFNYDKPPTSELLENEEYRQMTKPEILDLVPEGNFFFFPVNRDINIQFAMGKTALLGKLIRDCVRKKTSEGKVNDSIRLLEDQAREAIDEPRLMLQKYLREQMHNDALNLEFEGLSVNLVDGISFNAGLSDDKVGFVPLANRGAGTQNNLIIALFRYLAESETNGNLIIALEEPENSLHPKAQRQLLSVLMDLSQNHQVISTTHSPVFIERTQYESNILITRKSDGRSEAKIFSGELLEEVRSELGIRPSDALLKGGGNCALIVEGATEEESLPDCFEFIGKSEFELGISIINADGSDFQKIRRICSLLKAFDIPVVVLLDLDANATAEDLLRSQSKELSNLEEVVVLECGTIEDYFPKFAIRSVLNNDFKSNPEVTESDLPDSLFGEDLLNKISYLLHERKCGQGLPYFKRVLGMRAIKLMKERNVEIHDELKNVVNLVANIASRV